MEKVIIFNSVGEEDGFPSLEKEINNWMSKHAGKVRIIDRHVVSSAGNDFDKITFVNISVVIFYIE